MTIVRVVPDSGASSTGGPAPESWFRALVNECGFDEDVTATTESADVLYETVDGRIRRAGATLARRVPGPGWVLERGNDAPIRSGAEGFPPEGDPLEAALRHLVRRRGVFPLLAVRRRTRIFRLPRAAGRAGATLTWEELSFVDAHARRRAGGPRVLRLAADETAAGGDAASLLASRLENLGRADFDLLAEGCRALAIPVPGEPIPDPLRLVAEDPFPDAVAKLLARESLCLRNHAYGARYDLDPEFVHQLRVSTRRVRAALRIFRPELDRPPTEALRAELGWLGETLGRARDLDVLLASLPGLFVRARLDEAVTERITEAFRARRAATLRDAIGALASPRFQTLLRELETAPPPVTGPSAGKRVGDVAPVLVEKALKRVEKHRGGGSMGPEELHRVRIAFKRLRYIGEFFADFLDPRVARSIGTAVRFQDRLGALNDAEIQARRLDDLATSLLAERDRDRPAVLALGAMILVLRRRKEKERAAFETLWRRFPDEARRLRHRLRRADRR